MSDQMTFVVRPPVTLRQGNPIAILISCKFAALKADVSLLWWEEFSKTARACLTPDCEPEEMSKFIEVVRERFTVTEAPGFRLELPTQHEREHANG